MSTISGLDELFARKDRRRNKKSVAMLSTPEDVARQLDEAAERNEQRIRKEQMNSNCNSQQSIVHESLDIESVEKGEWAEFGENKRDYTGLKIGHLALSDEEQSQHHYLESDKTTNSTEHVNHNDEEVITSVWNKITKTERKEEIPIKTVPTENIVKGYKPPHLRMKMKQNTHSKHERVGRTAPDINSEQFFPTLTSNR